MQPSNVRSVKGIPIGSCKLCGADVVDRGKFYGCSSYFDTGCGFTISKNILGVEIPVEDIVSLLKTGDTGLIEGFRKKDGKGTFKAVLSWDDEQKRLVWKFPNSNSFKLPIDLLKPLIVYEPPLVEVEKDFEAIEKESFALKHPCKVVDVKHGPRITQYQLEPRKGVNISGYRRFKANFQAALRADKIVMHIPIPGTNRIGIEIPTKHPYPVQLRGLLENEEFLAKKKPLSFPLGMDLYGKPYYADLASMPHMLVAGTTGSGKSVFLNSIIVSLLYGNDPDELKLVLIDPKQVELSVYEGIPHLMSTVVKDAQRANFALKYLIKEMMNRYTLFEKARVRNIESYNNKMLENDPDGKKLPYIVVVIDEIADLIMTDPDKNIERNVVRLAQLSRAAGIHLIVATQRPTRKVLSPVIKGNMPVRVSFSVASSSDSMTILDQTGAENLLGKGDMIYLPKDAPKKRLQSGFVSDEEIARVVSYLQKKHLAKREEG